MKMDYEALFWRPLFISSLLLFFFLHLLLHIQTLENCMSMRIILNNAIISICKYAKM